MRKQRVRKSFRPALNALENRLVLNGTMLYVDGNIAADSKSHVHDGSSWANAFGNLQDALTEAATESGPTAIWIAQGTYKPSQIYSPLDANGVPVGGGESGLDVANLKTFDLPNNVSLYGGLVYGMTSLAQSNPVAHPTILSGDLGGNDINNPSDPGYAASKADNAWHVVTLGDDITQQGVTASLSGLQIIDGYADGGNVGGTLSPFIVGHSDGGGVYAAWGSNVTVNNDLFQYNFAASDGGGLFGNTSNIVAMNSRFLDNSALVRAGGLEGLNDFENGVSHTSILTNDYFQGNTCAVFGGAVVGEGADQGPNSYMSISACTFVGNQGGEGGALVFDTLTIRITGSTFEGNVATVDAGALATTNVVGTIVGAPNNFQTTVTNSTFVDNVAENDPVAHATLNLFAGTPGLNFAGGGGALVTYMNGYLNVDQDQFLGNQTENGDGGAILNGDASANALGVSAYAVQTTVQNSIFIGNSAPKGNGGAIASETDGLSPGSTVSSTVLSVSGSLFSANRAAGSGGAIYLGVSTAEISGNIFAVDVASAGDGIFGEASEVNGFASSNPLARAALKRANAFLADMVSLS